MKSAVILLIIFDKDSMPETYISIINREKEV